MVAAELAAIRLDDIVIAGRGGALQHAVCLLQLLVTGVPCWWLAERAAADAQHRFDLRQLHHGDAEPACHLAQQLPRGAFEIVPGQGRAHLDLKEGAQQSRPAAASRGQRRKLGPQIEVGLFARGEVIDGGSYLGWGQPQFGHHSPGGGDLALRYPAIRLCDVPHRAERGAEKLIADPGRFSAVLQARILLGIVRVLIELVAQQYAHGRPDRAARKQPNGRAYDFSGEFHTLPISMRCYSSKPWRAAWVALRHKANMSPPLPAQPVFRTALRSLERIHEGKVRDIYAVDARTMLIVTTDRLSAFDVVLPDPIPEKGRVLNEISNFWFGRTRPIVPNHLTDRPLDTIIKDPDERALLAGRAVIVHRLSALPIEAVVRGYLIGSGWKDYQKTGGICGIALPAGMKQAERLPMPLFTPATKAAMGEHDENISFSQVEAQVGAELAARVRDTAIALYDYAADHARRRGIIIADTKFEFGVDPAGQLTLIDEVLTPDSSRFWPADTYRPGTSPPSFDKQFVRDYLETLDWDKKSPGPSLPAEIIQRTSEKYREALARLTAPA